MVRVQKCCCFNLKTGCLVIAILGWIFTVVKIFGLIGAATSPYEPAKEQHTETNEFGTITLHNDKPETASTIGYKIGYAVVSLICCILLVVGIYKKSPGYFIPWMIVECLECIGITIATGAFFVFIFVFEYPGNLIFGILFVVCVGISVLCWYLWIVVYSYYQELKSGPNQVPTGGNVYYSPTSTNPPPYEKDRTQMA